MNKIDTYRLILNHLEPGEPTGVYSAGVAADYLTYQHGERPVALNTFLSYTGLSYPSVYRRARRVLELLEQRGIVRRTHSVRGSADCWTFAY